MSIVTYTWEDGVRSVRVGPARFWDRALTPAEIRAEMGVFRKAGGDTPNGTYVPVGNYGAVGDGVADDSAAVRRAVDDLGNVRVGPPDDHAPPVPVTDNVDLDALLYHRGVPRRRRYDWPSPKGGLAPCRHAGNPLHALACRDCGAALNRPVSRRFEMAPAFPWGLVMWVAILIATLAYALTTVSPEWAAILFK